MTAPNDEALAGDAAQRFEEHTQEISSQIVASSTPGDNTDDDQSGLAHRDEDRRGFGRIRAELALRGYSLLETNCGYLIARWGWSRIAPDMSAVGRFLKQVGGQQ